MPISTPFAVTLSSPDGKMNRAEIALRTWHRADGVRRGLIWGSSIAVVGLMMIPIPIIHFFSPIVVLLMAPLGAFLIYRMHAAGKDFAGAGTCPSCGDALSLSGSAERFPVHRVCPSCKNSVQIAP